MTLRKPYTALALCMALLPCAVYAQTPASVPAKAAAPAPIKTAKPAPLDTFNYIIGTQDMGSYYQFTDESLLKEGGDAILNMGSNMIKISIGPSYVKARYLKAKDPSIRSITDLARTPEYKDVFNMPFSRYFMWTYCFSTYNQVTPFHGHMKPELLAKEYQEVYDLTKYLLTTYNGTGKIFYLGNWEGDWHLLSGAPVKKNKWEEDVNPDAPIGMIDWLTARQRAVDDAKKATPHQNVNVYFYVETNLVQKSIKKNQVTVASSVLHDVNPDFVSYSSHDSTNPGTDMHHDLPAALDYMQSKLTPKPGLPEKRVFIGEFSAKGRIFTPQQQDEYVRDQIATSIKWGTPFALYWAIYCTSPNDGCWMIDDKGVKEPIYYTYQHYYADARAYIAGFQSKNQRKPNDTEFQAFAYKWFTTPEKAPANKGQE